MSREWTYGQYTYGDGYKDISTGVTIEWEFDTGGYDWETWALLSKEEDGVKLYAAYNDSGCSCVTPYELKPEKYDLAWTPNLKEAASVVSRLLRDIVPDERWGVSADKKAATLANLSATVMKLR